jgi:RNA polymerase-binding transcription factor DksA
VTTAKSTAAKKAPARSAAATKKSATAAKKPAAKTAAAKPIAKKAPVKKAPAAKVAAKKAAAKKPSASATKASAGKAPAKRKLSASELKFIESQHELLLKERATYLRQADSLKAEADSLAELREPGDVQFDEESGEGDTLAVERERDLALSHQARAAVEEIDHALAKIELGTYGICEVSGQPIPRERLKAIPWARERVEYKVGGFGRR